MVPDVFLSHWSGIVIGMLLGAIAMEKAMLSPHSSVREVLGSRRATVVWGLAVLWIPCMFFIDLYVEGWVTSLPIWTLAIVYLGVVSMIVLQGFRASERIARQSESEP